MPLKISSFTTKIRGHVLWQMFHELSKRLGKFFNETSKHLAQFIKIQKGSMTPPVGDGGATILQSWVCVSPSKQHVEMGRAPKAATDASTLACDRQKKRVGQVSSR